MTPAELKTLCESLRLNDQALAALTGVRDRTVRKWSSGAIHSIPADVAELLRRLDGRIASAAYEAVDAYAAAAEHHAGPGTVVLLRYRPADMARYRPDLLADAGGLQNVAAALHAALVDRIRQGVERLGGTVRITWMEAEAYDAWRDGAGRRDDDASRAAWAGERLAP